MDVDFCAFQIHPFQNLTLFRKLFLLETRTGSTSFQRRVFTFHIFPVNNIVQCQGHGLWLHSCIHSEQYLNYQRNPMFSLQAFSSRKDDTEKIGNQSITRRQNVLRRQANRGGNSVIIELAYQVHFIHPDGPSPRDPLSKSAPPPSLASNDGSLIYLNSNNINFALCCVLPNHEWTLIYLLDSRLFPRKYAVPARAFPTFSEWTEIQGRQRVFSTHF